MPRSRLGLGLDTKGLGSKRLGLVDKHFSITYIKLRLNMPLRFILSSRLPHFFLGLHQSSKWCGCGMWPRSWRLGLEAVSRRSSASTRSRLGVGTSRPPLGLELWNALVSVSSRLELSTPRSRPRSRASRSRSRLGLD